MEDMRHKVMKNLLWAVGGKIVTMLGSLFVGIVVARYLGPAQYGLMSYVISYVFLFQTLAMFGLDQIEVREEARGDVPFTTVIGTAFGIKLMLAVATIALCVGTSFLMEANATTTALVALYSLSILAQTFNVVRNYFMAIVQNEYVVKSEMSRTLLGMAIKGTLLWFNVSLVWFVMASMFDFVLLAGGYIVAYRTKVGRIRDWKFSSKYARFMVGQSWPLLLTSAAVILYQRIDQVMIGQMTDKTNVGFYSVAARFTEVLLYVPMMLAQTISPVLVRIRKEEGEAAYQTKAQQFMNISFWTSTSLSLCVSLLAYWIVDYTFGEKYLASVAVLHVLAFKTASVALSNTAGTMIIVEGRQRWVFIRDLLGCVVCITLNWLLLPRYGIIASAFVAIACNICAGYLADLIIPSFRHIFVRQTRTLLFGWYDMRLLPSLIRRRRHGNRP